MKNETKSKMNLENNSISASSEIPKSCNLKSIRVVSPKKQTPYLLSNTYPKKNSLDCERSSNMKSLNINLKSIQQGNSNAIRQANNVMTYGRSNSPKVKNKNDSKKLILPLIKIKSIKTRDPEIRKNEEENSDSKIIEKKKEINLKISYKNSIEIKTIEEKVTNIKQNFANNNVLGSYNNSSPSEKEKIDPNFFYVNILVIKYIIAPGNNSNIVKKCMVHRINWKECSSLSNHFNFKWQPVSSGTNYDSFNRTSTKQTFNHFEHHPQISNKLNLFINLMKYCENNNHDIFRFFPFTIVIHYDNISYIGQMENFSYLFNNITNFVCNSNDTSSLSKKYCFKKYNSMFLFNYPYEKLGNKTNLYINSDNFDGKNIWLLKAPDLNRGRCIRIVNNLNEIHKLIKKFNEGVMREFKDKEDDRNNDSSSIIYEKIAINRKNKKDFNSINYMELLKEDDKKRSEQERENFGLNGKKYRTSTMILQKYIEKPLLYHGRKFDIRIWVLFTHNNDIYAFKEGHLKTASLQYTNENIDSFVHLTNYSVQKYNDNFSKFEFGNEVNFSDFQTFLDNYQKDRKISVRSDIWKRILEIITITGKAVKEKVINTKGKYFFEVFGYDFIMDANYGVYLLEINTNPGLEESSPLIKMLVPRMIDDALRLTIDQIYETKYSCLDDGKFSSLFHVYNYANTENLWEFVCNLNEKEKKNRN